jgi:SAM-dependent methyltransferase
VSGPHAANPWLATRTRGGDEYDAPYEQRAARGENVHGEADFVTALGAKSVLDAGCGTGRIARELDRRGLDVAGVDLDDVMLDTGRRKAPHIRWLTGDLETVDLGRTFDVVLMAGNVMIYLTPGTEGRVLENVARHLEPGGLLVAGFQRQPGKLSLRRFDELSREAGLALGSRFATWDREPFLEGGAYAVSVMRKG